MAKIKEIIQENTRKGYYNTECFILPEIGIKTLSRFMKCEYWLCIAWINRSISIKIFTRKYNKRKAV